MGPAASGDIFPFSPLNSLLAIVGRRDHLVTPALLRSLVESELWCQRLEDARIPCYVGATDVLDGREVAIAAGRIATALLASAAIPAVHGCHSTDDDRRQHD